MKAILNGIHNNLNKKIKNLFIKANTIIIQKKLSQLLSGSVNLWAINLAFSVFESILESTESLSEKMELNRINIEGKPTSVLNSVLFNKANIITHNWEGFKNKKIL